MRAGEREGNWRFLATVWLGCVCKLRKIDFYFEFKFIVLYCDAVTEKLRNGDYKFEFEFKFNVLNVDVVTAGIPFQRESP